MSNRVEITEDNLQRVSGGAITYTWDGEQGSLGINGRNIYTLVDKKGFLEVYHEMFGKYNDLEIIAVLKEKGYIYKP